MDHDGRHFEHGRFLVLIFVSPVVLFWRFSHLALVVEPVLAQVQRLLRLVTRMDDGQGNCRESWEEKRKRKERGKP